MHTEDMIGADRIDAPLLRGIFAAAALALPAAASQQDPAAPAEPAAVKVVELDGLRLRIPARFEPPPWFRSSRTQFSFRERHVGAEYRARIPVPEAKVRWQRGAEFAVFHFGEGGAGSEREVVRDWIAQFARKGAWRSVEPDPVVAIRRGPCAGGTYTLVDVTGTYVYDQGPVFRFEARLLPGRRMLAAVLPSDEGPFYVKLTGPEPIVTAAAAEFRATFAGDADSEVRLDRRLRVLPATVHVRFELDGEPLAVPGCRLRLGSATAVADRGGALFDPVEPGQHELQVPSIEGYEPVAARRIDVERGRQVRVVVVLRPRPR